MEKERESYGYVKEVDLNDRDAMVSYLKNHFRYHTANSWNASTSYAHNMKVNNFPLTNEETINLLNLMDAEDAYRETDFLVEEFNEENKYLWQAGFNGRSGGYLVLYMGGLKDTGYKSYCTNCGQKNYKSVLETGTKCGRCNADARMDYKITPKEVFTYPGKAVDMDEDYEDWDDEQLRERVKLVQRFDRLAEDIAGSACYMARNCHVEEEEVMVPRTVRTVAEN